MKFMFPLIAHGTDFRTWLYYSAIILGSVAFMAYTLFQARFLIAGPEILLNVEPDTVHQERTLALEGTTENIVALSLNGREIYTDKSGYFKEVIILENGYTITTLEARDRYGRTTKLERHFVYIPSGEETTVTNI